MVCLSLGKIDKNIIPILIGCIFEIICSVLIKYDVFTFYNHLIITTLYGTIFQVFAFIPFIILEIRMKNNKIKDDSVVNNKTTYIYTDNQKEITKHKYLFIFLSSTLFLVEEIMLFYTINLKVNYWVLDIIAYCLINYLIFDIKLYKHHYLSIIIIILTGLILDISLEHLQNDIINNWPLDLLRLLREIIYSMHIVTQKYTMEKKFCSVYELTGFNGIFLIIFLIILSLLNIYCIKLDDFDEYFNELNTEKILIGLLNSFIEFILFLSVCFTIKNNTSCHIYLISVCLTIADSFMNFSKNTIIAIICLAFILFMSLVFFEIIEINCFGLSYNTKRNIMKREINDNTSLDKNLTFDSENSNVQIQLETFVNE